MKRNNKKTTTINGNKNTPYLRTKYKFVIRDRLYKSKDETVPTRNWHIPTNTQFVLCTTK